MLANNKEKDLELNKKAGKHLEINRKQAMMKLYNRRSKTNAATNVCKGLYTCNKL